MQKRPRGRHAGELETEDSLEFLWAVSYSDLLLVLMSFFVLYFSVNDNDKNQVLDQITLALKSNIKEIAPSAGGTGSGVGTSAGTRAENTQMNLDQARQLFGGIQSSFVNTSFKVTSGANLERGLTIDLPEQFYGKAEFKLSKKRMEMLNEVYKQLVAYKDQIKVTVIGHTDKAQLVSLSKDIASSNIGLSSLRAVRAADYLEALGLDKDSVEAKGAGSTIRNTRSISIQIQLKGAQ